MLLRPPFLLFWILLLSLGSISAQTSSGGGMHLEDAIRYAQSQSNAVKNARLQIADAEQQVKEQLATGLPNINGSLDYTHYLKVPILPLPEAFAASIPPGQEVPDGIAFQLKNNFVAGVSASAMLFNGSFFVGLKAAKEAKKFYELDLANQERAVRNEVVNAYLPLLLLQENLDQLDRNIDNLNKLLTETSALFEAGFVERLDVDRLQLNFDNLQTERDNLARQQENAKRALKYSMNYPLEEPLEMEDQLERIATDIAPELLLGAIDYTQRTEVRVLDQSLVLQGLNVDLQRSAFLPSLNATLAGQYQFQANKFSDGFWAPTVLVGLSAQVPIYDFGGRNARVQRAKLEVEKAANQRNDLVRGIELAVTNARSDYSSAQDRLAARQRSRDLAERIYATTQIKYKEGVGSSLEVVQAEQELYTAQSNYLTALYEIIIAKENLRQALGR